MRVISSLLQTSHSEGQQRKCIAVAGTEARSSDPRQELVAAG